MSASLVGSEMCIRDRAQEARGTRCHPSANYPFSLGRCLQGDSPVLPLFQSTLAFGKVGLFAERRPEHQGSQSR
eukprot:8666985-Alexandrium_andersonii.AAC.1